MATPQCIVFFDHDCLLCNRFVHYLLKHDRQKKFYFAPLQGETFRQYLPDNNSSESVVLYENNTPFYRSTAVIKILASIPIWRFLRIFLFIPRRPRDILYRIIAHNRHKFFKNTCHLPIDKKRFLP